MSYLISDLNRLISFGPVYKYQFGFFDGFFDVRYGSEDNKRSTYMIMFRKNTYTQNVNIITSIDARFPNNP
jgi:hypothetical protein